MRLRTLDAVNAVLIIVTTSFTAYAETVSVAHGSDVDLKTFQCTDIAQQGGVERVCYDGAKKYLLIRHDKIWRHFCSVEGSIAQRFLASHSMEHYLGAILDNHHACRRDNMPKYE